MSRYEGLTRDQIEARLAAAEDVCAMYAWSPSRRDTDPEKAAHELWRYWCDVSGMRCSSAEFPHLTDEVVKELARRRDAARSATLEHFFSPLDA